MLVVYYVKFSISIVKFLKLDYESGKYLIFRTNKNPNWKFSFGELNSLLCMLQV